MGIALWRSRAVPRWLAALFFVGLQVAELMGSFGPIVILYMLPFAAAMVLLAARIWSTAASPQDRIQHPGAGQCDGLRICPARKLFMATVLRG